MNFFDYVLWWHSFVLKYKSNQEGRVVLSVFTVHTNSSAPLCIILAAVEAIEKLINFMEPLLYHRGLRDTLAFEIRFFDNDTCILQTVVAVCNITGPHKHFDIILTQLLESHISYI